MALARAPNSALGGKLRLSVDGFDRVGGIGHDFVILLGLRPMMCVVRSR